MCSLCSFMVSYVHVPFSVQFVVAGTFLLQTLLGVAGDVQFFLMPWPNNFLRLPRKNVT